MSYGSDNVDAFRFAAGYVDRILKGLPVQGPNELVIRADEVIE
jgi:hypothetical protein